LVQTASAADIALFSAACPAVGIPNGNKGHYRLEVTLVTRNCDGRHSRHLGRDDPTRFALIELIQFQL
jgi:hypothetical protein